jgi:SWIM zinc finger
VRESVETKARRYLIEGRIRVRLCNEESGIANAEIRGSGAVYAVDHDDKGWRCSCPAKSKDCAHILALKLLTVLEPREAR